MVDRNRIAGVVSLRSGRRCVHQEPRGAGSLRIVVALCLTSVVYLAGCGGPLRVADPHFGEHHARQNNMPILFYFKAWDSTQHRNMILKVFENPQVKRELTGIITIELEYAWSKPYKDRYHIKKPQVCVLCKPDGTQVHEILHVSTVPTPEQFIEWLKAAKAVAMPKPTSAPAKPAPKPVEQKKP